MRCLIFGISGQDGSYLAEYLLSLGYEVHGTIRRNSTPEHQESRIGHLEGKITTYYADLLDEGSIFHAIQQSQPDEIYNLAAQSHVRISSDLQAFTLLTNTAGPLKILECIKDFWPKTKYYQASSSEMFGSSVDVDGFQRESTKMLPVSPYGISKLGAYHFTRHYRSQGFKTYNGILFNHESPRRGSNFVTNKIIKAAVNIKNGTQKTLELGNLDSFRDWGHSKDYVRAMHLIMQQEPGDWVVATGETRSVRELCDYVFTKLGLNYLDYVTINPKFFRPEELPYLKGDCSRIKELGWKPEYTFESMISEMIEAWRK